MTQLGNLPSFGKPKTAVKDPYDFDLDDVEVSSAREDNTFDKYSRAQNMLKDQEEEETAGYKIKAPTQAKAPAN
jgi:hypothetical protein